MRHGMQSRRIFDQLTARIKRLYPNAASDTLRRVRLLLGRYDTALPPIADDDAPRWTAADNVLITYGDTVRVTQAGAKTPPLETLGQFCRERLAGVVDTIHILPFCPWSSDDGFSVIDYTKVDANLGDWDDIRALQHDFRLMFDLVLNHCSSRSGWFRDYLTGIAPPRYFFHEVEPGTDLSAVTRPRQSPLLTKVRTRAGDRWVWTTFSADQVDLNFANPDVLMEFLEILLTYVVNGARIIRLDAIAYLWKTIGTPCIHLPETHEVVKLMRDVLELMAPHVVLLTETNVPHEQNVSYFGDGDEAHMVYNFSLPPLTLHALQTGTAKHLTKWAASLSDPPPGCTYLNFTASHDGVGVRPLEGLLPKKQITELADTVKQLGGHVSEKSNSDGSTSPYELNIAYFDAMARPGEDDADMKVRRFLCSQLIALGLRGVPAMYFHSLVATPNDHLNVKMRGYPRAINRHKWEHDKLAALLDDPDTVHARVFDEYGRVIRLRAAQPAFDPDAAQKVHRLGDELLVFTRKADDQSICCVHNLTNQPVDADVSKCGVPFAKPPARDLLTDETLPTPGLAPLAPYQVRWLTPATPKS
ncbi:MAG: DUF3459 domain-containing protein [Phycisphaera sp.]|nr:DUF3459 domain-containing protein [Phycisphaera sp.]